MIIKTEEMTEQKSQDNIFAADYIETPWDVIESYFKGRHLERLVRHQIESYNNFIEYQTTKTIEMFNPVNIKSEQDFDPVTGKHRLELFISFENFHLYRPQIHENNGATKLMFPQEVRSRNFTYASAMTIDINVKFVVRDGTQLENVQTFYKTLPKIHIGKMPIMLKSNICVLTQYKHMENKNVGECKYDTGGYFIINGSEKTVLGQERAAENKIYIYNVSKNNTKYTWSAEIKSVPDFKCISPKQLNIMISSKNNGLGQPIVVQLPRVKQPIPLFVLFRALGVISDLEICKYIILDINNKEYKELLNGLVSSIVDSNTIMTEQDALKHLTSYVMFTPINMDKDTGTRKKMEFTLDILSNDLLPHCATKQQKLYFLGYMTNKLLQAHFKWIVQDDRDSYLNKRVDLTGTLLNNLFRNYFNKLVKDMEKQLIKEINNGSWKSTDQYMNIINMTNIYKIIKSTTIENGLKKALSTGDFGIKHANSNKVGVAQVLNRLTYVSSLSHMRRISTPTDKRGKLIPPRKLHNTSWGYLCPAETPEGQSVGVVKNLAYMCHITISSNSEPIYNNVMIHIIDINTCSQSELYGKIKVFINGCWVGVTNDPIHLYNYLKLKKQEGIINIYTSIVFDYKLGEIRVCNDAGRLTRPVLRVKDNKLIIKNSIIEQLQEGEIIWDDLLTNCKLSESVIEYIDPDEQSSSMIAMTPADLEKQWKLPEKTTEIYKYTHCEIHPSTIFGILASCIPFPEHNQSPRNTYQCLDLFEPVLMASGKKKRICDIDVGDHVATFNPRTLEITNTKVIRHFVIKNQNPIYKINCQVSDSNDSIIATDDHIFMTTNGWLTVYQIRHTYKSNNIKIGYYENTIPKFCNIISFELQPDNFVCDIEVESDNHSFLAGNSCFMSHNCAQAKQAMGVYVTNYDNRMDKTSYVLTYPGRPLVDTRIMDMIHINDIPSGFTVVVAIMTHTGYNQEDSLLFNKGSIDRGLFQATIYHTEKDEDKQKVNGDEEIRCKPDSTKTKGMKFANYNKVNSKGVIPENTLIENRDVIIAKITPIKENKNDPTKVIKYEDKSRVYRTNEEIYVDKNYIDRNGDGYNFAKVRVRAVRKPVIGDKFSSRSGQKGTIGNIIPEEDMPFTKDGIRPDIILNPHAIPSRMTIGQLKETILAKVLISLGLFGDGTSFRDLDVDIICEELLKAGYETSGNELLYNGLTGEQHECSIFTGPVFYQRLKHMVLDKQHSRSIGPMVNMTRQPAEGRSRDGGLRFGEMERDTTIAHGAARFTRERLYDVSDKYSVYVCKKCGMIASYNDAKHIHRCRTCNNRTDFSYVEIPYACKLLFQELITMNIAPRIMTEN
jgi:DNA-directed RNA polymerase II subunit RPB2